MDMKSLLLICVFLLSLQTLVLPARNRPSVPRTPWRLLETEGGVAMEAITIPSKAQSAVGKERGAVWRALLHKGHPWRQTGTPSNQNSSPQRHSRERRQVRGQLMRVGCVLGTCQVQNLSHRLYQLMGQSGRQDSSPINPRSPHSYG